MTERTAIEWTDSTFNPWIGCTKISPGCDHCYAERDMDTRLGRARWGAGQPRVRTSAANWAEPNRWNRTPFFECIACRWRGPSANPETCGCEFPHLVSTRRRVFCASLADVFDNEVDPLWRADLFDLIRATPNLDWLLLTKRIGNADKMIGEALMRLGDRPRTLPNVWLGATIVDQAEADRDVPKLLATPARVRFLSCEPLLGAIDLRWLLTEPTGKMRTHNGRRQMQLQSKGLLHWVIAGGESGPHARPMRPDWARALRDQCASLGVSFLFKQWGEWVDSANLPSETLEDLELRGLVGDGVARVGKKIAGRELDGRKHTQFPEAA